MSLKKTQQKPEREATPQKQIPLLVFTNIILTCGVLCLSILLLPSQFSDNPCSHREALFSEKNRIIP